MPWRRRRVTQVDQTAPPPRRPLLWPWLLLLLLLVATGIAAAYFLTRDDDDSSSASRVPAVVGLREAEAVERLRADGYPADVRRAVNPALVGRVIRQLPSSGAEQEPGQTVVIIVARRPNTVDVPRVVGLDVADAFERVQAAGLRARSVEVFARQAKGRVTQQRPPARAEASRGSTVVLRVSKGPQLVGVPAVIGQREAAATAALRRVGLRVNIVRVPAPGSLSEGTVLAQNPRGGARAPKGSTVRLNIASAPAGGTTQTAPTTTTGEAPVPNVVGSRDIDAIARLQAAGFRVSSTRVSSTRPPGTVLTQSPAGGTTATRGSTVRITVSGGRVRTVPDVVGETEAAAARILRNAGFTVRAVDRVVTDPGQEGLVVEQDPRAETRVQGTTRVTIFIGRLA
jgi:eukaryotic-like serine/threonine-protein kinase